MTFQELVLAEVDAGNVRSFRHPFLPLTGYGYTETCQYGKLWNDVNKQCRGLVLDDAGNVIARGFDKFFNYEELSDEQKTFGPSDIDSITTKEDGSLIIAFFYADEWRFMTRGSFVSEQAALAEKIAYNNFTHPGQGGYAGLTYLMELVGPSNRIVTRHHPEDKLILLAVLRTDLNGSSSEIPNMTIEAKALKLETVGRHTWSDSFLKEVKAITDPNFEGVVVKLKNGLRFKLKTETYVKLHRVITGEFTPKRCLELWLQQRQGMAFDANIPDEFYTEIKGKIAEVQTTWLDHENKAFGIVQLGKHYKKDGQTRKDLAIRFEYMRPYLNCIFGQENPEEVALKLFCKEYLQ